eukprot:evm.model.NODE_4650_length_26121_cov_23.177099.7
MATEVVAQAFVHTSLDTHEELLSKTNAILESAKSRRWFRGGGNEKELCLIEAAQYESQAKELRVAIGLLGPSSINSSSSSSSSRSRSSTNSNMDSNMNSKAPTVDTIPLSEQQGQEMDEALEEGQERAQEQPAIQTVPTRASLLLGAVKGFLFRRLIDGDLDDALQSVKDIQTLADCLKTQAELDVGHWMTGGGYVKPEELELLYLVRQIILCEGEKARYYEKHPTLDRHNESELKGESVDVCKRLLRYKSLFHIRSNRWFNVYCEDYQVAADPHFPQSKPNSFHVQCFFDGTIREEDVANDTIGARIREAEKKRRFRLPSPFRNSTSLWGSISSSNKPQFSFQGFLTQMTSSFFVLGQMLTPTFFFHRLVQRGPKELTAYAMDEESKEADVDANV